MGYIGVFTYHTTSDCWSEREREDCLLKVQFKEQVRHITYDLCHPS